MPLILDDLQESASGGPSKRRRALRDLVLYVAIAVVIVAAIWMFGAHEARVGGPEKLPLNWIGFVGVTAIVFGYEIQDCRQLWRERKLWVLLGLVFVAHCGLGLIVLLKVATLPTLLYAILIPIEFDLLDRYLNFFMNRH